MKKIREQLKEYNRARRAINEQYPIAHAISTMMETGWTIIAFIAIKHIYNTIFS